MIIANMQLIIWKTWLPRLSAFLVALLLAASVVFWVMRWPARADGAALPVAAGPEGLPPADASALARLLGANAPVAQASPDAASRFRLTGIVGMGSGQGVALVSLDGKPAKAYRVGSQLDEGWVLQSVETRSVALGTELKGPVLLQLELPRQP